MRGIFKNVGTFHISKTLEIIHRLEGRGCVLCSKPGARSEVHHIIPKSKVNGRARAVVESRPELLGKLCPEHHRGLEGVHSLKEARQWLFDHKVTIYGLESMREALEAVNEHLKIKLTWESLGYDLLDK